MKRITLLILCLTLACACSKSRKNSLTQRSLQKQKVAVAQFDGEKSAREMVEVALVNEILDHARFEIVDRNSVLNALATYPAESDRQRLGKKVGADLVLSIKIEEFRADTKTGLDEIMEADSVLTEEWHESSPVIAKKYVKVKALDGTVRLRFEFVNVESGETTHTGAGAAQMTVNSRDKSAQGMDLPRKLEFLEDLSAKAVRDFFEKLPE